MRLEWEPSADRRSRDRLEALAVRLGIPAGLALAVVGVLAGGELLLAVGFTAAVLLGVLALSRASADGPDSFALDASGVELGGPGGRRIPWAAVEELAIVTRGTDAEVGPPVTHSTGVEVRLRDGGREALTRHAGVDADVARMLRALHEAGAARRIGLVDRVDRPVDHRLVIIDVEAPEPR